MVEIALFLLSAILLICGATLVRSAFCLFFIPEEELHELRMDAEYRKRVSIRSPLRAKEP